jgi:RNA recognition motif-containing protein
MNIYVFNLSSAIRSEDLKSMFMAYGNVSSAEIVKDIISGESRGFGYVEMQDSTEAGRAIEALDQIEVDTLSVTVQMNHR